MGLDLRDLIDKPGGRVSFSYDLDTERISFPSVISYPRPPHAEGFIENQAGALTLRGLLTADMLCRCDRCASEYELRKEIRLEIPLAAELQDEENPDIFLIEGDALDLDDVLETSLVLDMESKFLCRPDCAGLCAVCGANLNDGPCNCRNPNDPRLAVLEQLLDESD